MEAIVIEAKVRKETKKEASKKYRREGFIPSVLYGQENNINLLIDSKTFMKLYPHLTKSTLINIKVDNDNYDVLIKDYHKNYIKNEFIHLDFYELKKGKTVHASIHINFIGSPIGTREGGILEKHLLEIQVECLPKDMVSHFELNIENMDINDTLHVSDIQLDERYKLLSNPDDVLVHVSGQIAEEIEEVEEEVVEGEEGAEETAEGAEDKEDKKEEAEADKEEK